MRETSGLVETRQRVLKSEHFHVLLGLRGLGLSLPGDTAEDDLRIVMPVRRTAGRALDFDILPQRTAVVGSFDVGFLFGVAQVREEGFILIDSDGIQARPPGHDAGTRSTAGTGEQERGTAKRKDMVLHGILV